MNYRKLRAQLERVGGPTVERDLVAAFARSPVVLLAGDQASGKSTTARHLASVLGGSVGSTGAIVRARAAQLGVSFEELNASIDVLEDCRNDLAALRAVGAGTVVVFESRLAGHLGCWLRGLGRSRLVSAYLQCQPRERALRVVERATSTGTRAEVEQHLGNSSHHTFEQILDVCLQVPTPEIARAVATLRAAQRRDESDRARIRALYDLDYTDVSVFDLVLDTTADTAEELARTLAARIRDSETP